MWVHPWLYGRLGGLTPAEKLLVLGLEKQLRQSVGQREAREAEAKTIEESLRRRDARIEEERAKFMAQEAARFNRELAAYNEHLALWAPAVVSLLTIVTRSFWGDEANVTASGPFSDKHAEPQFHI